MSLGVVLDVAVGLALTYMLLGLVASAAQEAFAATLSWRGRHLRTGIANLIAGTGRTDPAVRKLFHDVFGHALVQGVAAKGLPSYVPSRNFASALFATLADGSDSPVFGQIEQRVKALPDCGAKACLTAFLHEAGGDLDKLRKSVETWYDDAMDRLSGVYKRFTQYFALAFGLIFAIIFNINSITIAETLWGDPDKRAAIVAVASRYAGQNSQPAAAADLSAQFEATQKALAALPLPMGWTLDRPKGETVVGVFFTKLVAPDWSGVWLVLGWAITALAVSLGAPFWFDALKKVVNIRASGPKPVRSDEQN